MAQLFATGIYTTIWTLPFLCYPCANIAFLQFFYGSGTAKGVDFDAFNKTTTAVAQKRPRKVIPGLTIL